jgi:hypothetical protein
MLRLFSTLFVALFGCAGIVWLLHPGTVHTVCAVEKSKFSVIIAGPGETVPEKGLLLSLDEIGRLTDLLGHEVGTAGLKSLFHSGRSKKPFVILLQFSNQKRTSFDTLAKVLTHFKKATDPRKDTVIYIYLHNFSFPRKKKSPSDVRCAPIVGGFPGEIRSGIRPPVNATLRGGPAGTACPRRCGSERFVTR